MEITKLAEGKLNVAVSSEGNFICRGTQVVISQITKDMGDGFKSIWIEVRSIGTVVRLNFFDTDVDWLMGVK